MKALADHIFDLRGFEAAHRAKKPKTEVNMNKKKLIQQAWIQEYHRKGIPSSFRKGPTATVVTFVSWLKEKQESGVVADIGAGQGRNSFYLATQGFQVKSLELLQENVDLSIHMLHLMD